MLLFLYPFFSKNEWNFIYFKVDQYGFFGADIDILAIHGPIANTDISKIFKSCFLLHYQKYNVFYALPFFQNFNIQDL